MGGRAPRARGAAGRAGAIAGAGGPGDDGPDGDDDGDGRRPNAGGAGGAAHGAGQFGGAGAAGADAVVRHSRDYKWPRDLADWNDYRVAYFDLDQCTECVPGFVKLKPHERDEIAWWYSIQARLDSYVQNLEQGVLRGDEPCVAATLRQCADQGQERISILEQTTRARSGRSEYNVEHWKELQRDDLEDRLAVPVRGRLGQLHEQSRISRRAARSKARANAAFKNAKPRRDND